jgi:hypothetical protein
LLRQLERIPGGLLGGRIGSDRAADPDNRWALSFNTCLFTQKAVAEAGCGDCSLARPPTSLTYRKRWSVEGLASNSLAKTRDGRWQQRFMEQVFEGLLHDKAGLPAIHLP